MDENKHSNISKARTEEEIGDFWETHDFTDFDTDALDVEYSVSFAVPVEIELFDALEKAARKHGVNVETLVNLWLQQKLEEQG
jgi:predicted DNA binding CopG/RHH family protein